MFWLRDRVSSHLPATTAGCSTHEWTKRGLSIRATSPSKQAPAHSSLHFFGRLA